MKPYRIFSIFFLATLILSACGASAPETENPPLRVEYTFWWGDHTMLVAQELGLFEKHNVNVEPTFYEVYSDALPALAAGTIDGGFFGPGDVLLTNINTDLKVVAVNDDGGFNYIIGSPEIQTPADLRGKRIGVPLGTTYEIFAIRALEEGGLTRGDVTFVDITVEDVPAALGNTIDAGYTWDPFASDAIEDGATLLLKSGGSSTITPDVLVFRADVVQQRPDDIRAFLSAWFEAIEFRYSNPEEANQIIATALGISPSELSEDAYIFNAQENVALFSNESPADTVNLLEAFTTNANYLINNGSLGNQPNLIELLDASFLP